MYQLEKDTMRNSDESLILIDKMTQKLKAVNSKIEYFLRKEQTKAAADFYVHFDEVVPANDTTNPHEHFKPAIPFSLSGIKTKITKTMKNITILSIFLIALSANAQFETKAFIGYGTHEQSEQPTRGARSAFNAGLQIESPDYFVGFRTSATYAAWEVDGFLELDAKIYTTLFSDHSLAVYVGIGGAYETNNGDISPAFGIWANVRVTDNVFIGAGWHPTVNGRFRGPKGWTNYVGGGISIKL